MATIYFGTESGSRGTECSGLFSELALGFLELALESD